MRRFVGYEFIVRIIFCCSVRIVSLWHRNVEIIAHFKIYFRYLWVNATAPPMSRVDNNSIWQIGAQLQQSSIEISWKSS